MFYKIENENPPIWIVNEWMKKNFLFILNILFKIEYISSNRLLFVYESTRRWCQLSSSIGFDSNINPINWVVCFFFWRKNRLYNVCVCVNKMHDLYSPITRLLFIAMIIFLHHSFILVFFNSELVGCFFFAGCGSFDFNVKFWVFSLLTHNSKEKHHLGCC